MWKWRLFSCVQLDLYSPRHPPGQNTGVGSFSLPQGIFPTQGLNPGLRHFRQILYQLSHKGSPRILKRVAYSLIGYPLQYSWLENPMMEEPGKLQSMGLQRARHDWATSLTFLLQQIFPAQELNQDLLYCRQILYQLSHDGSPSLGLLFPISEPVHCSMYSSNPHSGLTHIQVSHKIGKVVSYTHFFENFPTFVVIHVVKAFSLGNEAEVDAEKHLEFSCFFMI